MLASLTGYLIMSTHTISMLITCQTHARIYKWDMYLYIMHAPIVMLVYCQKLKIMQTRTSKDTLMLCLLTHET